MSLFLPEKAASTGIKQVFCVSKYRKILMQFLPQRI